MGTKNEGSKAAAPGYEQVVAENAKLKADLAKRDDTIAKMEADKAAMKGILSKVLCIMMSLNGMDGNFITKGFDNMKSYVEIIEKHLDAVVAAMSGRHIRGDGRHRVWMRMCWLDEFIQNDHLLHALTLLKPEVFEYVVYKVQEYIESHPNKLYYGMGSRKTEPGNRSKLKIRHMVFVTFFKKRTNVVDAVTGALFGMDRTTVIRQTEFIDSVLKKVLPTISNVSERLSEIENSDDFIKFVGGGLMHDGTLTTAPRFQIQGE